MVIAVVFACRFKVAIEICGGCILVTGGGGV